MKTMNSAPNAMTVASLHRLIDESVSSLPSQNISLEFASGRILAEAAASSCDLPQWDYSAMDGYAILNDAKPGIFHIEGVILPGDPPPIPPSRASAWRVYTGSLLPSGVIVVMQEQVQVVVEGIQITAISQSDYVRKQGSTARIGDEILPAGTAINPASLAILHAIGMTKPKVIPSPTVAHLTTGREIIPAGNIPEPGQVRNTNAPMIRALLQESGISQLVHDHSDESLQASRTICRRDDFANADLLLVSGGSSVGDHDHTQELLEELGFEILCQKVLCRPGKPFLFGEKGRQIAVGLPGNPVSHFVSFHLFVKRILHRLMGYPVTKTLSAILSPGTALDDPQLETYWPGEWRLRHQEMRLAAKPWLNSGQLTALVGVNALIRLPANQPAPQSGECVEFLPLAYGEILT